MDVEDSPRMPLLRREGLHVPGGYRLPEVVKRGLRGADVQLHALSRQRGSPEQACRLPHPIQHLLLATSEWLAVVLVDACHVAWLVQQRDALDDPQLRRAQALDPLHHGLCNPQPNRREWDDLAAARRHTVRPELGLQRPDAVIGAVAGARRHEVQVKHDLQVVLRGLPQQPRQPLAVHGDEGRFVPIHRVRHDLGARLVDRRVDGGQGVREGGPWQRHTHAANAQTGDFLQVVASDVRLPVRREDLQRLLVPARVLQPLRQKALGLPRRVFQALEQRGQADALACGALRSHMAALCAREEPILKHQPSSQIHPRRDCCNFRG
mmetsp:Transcript_144542/g.366882  ORF Transcript_144542/g.366882 Transcript_144542/m.366882 type:complete len:323 (-) Transcript_144542:298-1266(-)